MSPVKVGLIALVIIVVGTYLGFTRDIPLVNQPYLVNAAFQDSAGIKQGSPVRIAGVEVGKVHEVKHTSPGSKTALVKMAINDQGRPVHEDATAAIRPRIFLEGNFFVDLQPGSPGADEMEDGQTIPIERTSYPVQFDQVLKALQSDTREDLRATFAELARTQTAGGARAFNRSLEYQADAYRYSAIVSDALLGERDTDLSDWIREQGTVAEALDKNPERLRSLITQFNRFAGALAAEEQSLRLAVRELPNAIQASRPAFDALNRAFPPVRRFAREALPGVRSTPATVDVTLPLVRQLRGLMRPAELRGLSRDLRRATPGLASMARQSVPLLEQQRLMASCTSEVLVPAGDQEVPDEKFKPTGPSYQEFAKVLANLAGESRSFDANGQWFKVLGGGGAETLDLGDNVFGSAISPLSGVQPPPDRTRPPLERRVPCETQQVPNYDTEPMAPPGKASNVDPSAPEALKRAEEAKEAAMRILLDRLDGQGIRATPGPDATADTLKDIATLTEKQP